MYVFLDVFFVVLHGLLVAFVLTGWVFRPTRRLHLLVMASVFVSWFGLGLAYGWGYCPSTDWHWGVKRALGETNLPNSYVKYYLDRVTGSEWDPGLVDGAVLGFALAALGVSAGLNWTELASTGFRRPRESSGAPAERAAPRSENAAIPADFRRTDGRPVRACSSRRRPDDRSRKTDSRAL